MAKVFMGYTWSDDEIRKIFRFVCSYCGKESSGWPGKRCPYCGK